MKSWTLQTALFQFEMVDKKNLPRIKQSLESNSYIPDIAHDLSNDLTKL